MTDQNLIYTGKAKDLYRTDQPGILKMVYKNQATAGNGAKKEEIPGKGVLNQAINQLIFTYLAEAGIPTHLVEVLNAREELVKEAQMFPLEVVFRNYAAGSFVKRLGVEKGTPIEDGVLEFFYKADALNDPFINDDDIRFLQAATEAELQEIKALTRRINTLLVDLFKQAGLILVDFKLEFGRTAAGEIVLADEFSPDNARLWDVETKASFDKDIFRNDEGDIIPFYEAVLSRLEALTQA
ncbi:MULTISPECIES: phosphoribosylaminoimidazolesuccinocarboxamide synthase [Aerococcus]|uniref:Phosphoribosylaminoimidazole-succinocarboxamide synthase n=1 Tax=Aerococcus sanguinicola TaxID=119206 RepID=A0A5N1GLR4_9LACT|nr:MULTISPECIES: phosphoribosylaminoimidazolesuccinocarboxamide synthase [Aerococcus]KAA9301179.1 phosphoribosylaminoimidazolesuccinocarboxamide synthase [Aerococcus sanguinicola]MDK6369291.1 phosphoribosylaminoimidazolesuccinocarboxamide synthase [Aerococcus sp. UMB9870]MDK6679115.1 phosphoribosylaminoimidazolesuccinocarboxamide synthase [Aerococcus sp. UMB8608]MDK6687022.1 phosphoribosylaminoimidazolesuccinocarboxamide synthase [Aerococcus sp. UMB8623]MDK6941156.1 phosphoribosylaminoimidazol